MRISRYTAVLLMGWVVLCGYSCAVKTPAPGPHINPVAPPFGLSVTDITSASALLAWSGEEASYEVKVGESLVAVTGNSYSPSLRADNRYSWHVRAVKENECSVWVEGPGFGTLPEGSAVFLADVAMEGETEWRTTAATALYLDKDAMLITISANNDPELPRLAVKCPAAEGETLFPEAYDIGYFLEYFSPAWNERQVVIDGVEYGDWQINEGALRISSFDGLTVSGSASVKMHDYYSFNNGSGESRIKSLELSFAGVPVEL